LTAGYYLENQAIPVQQICHLDPQQSRHPERSASQIYRKQKALCREVEGPRRCLLADALGSFPAANYTGDKKSQTPSEAEGSGVLRTVRGNVCSKAPRSEFAISLG
jgi:hypothetical protein